jgi:hypothetical protein
MPVLLPSIQKLQKNVKYYVELLKAETHPARDEFHFKLLRFSRKAPYQFV